MNIEPIPSGFLKQVRVRVDTQGEWSALLDGLPKPSVLGIHNLPFAANVAEQLMSIQNLHLGQDESGYVTLYERQLRKIGKNLTRYAIDPSSSQDELFGRIAVKTTIDDFFTKNS